MNTFNLIVLSILSLILIITTLEFSFSENRHEPDQSISVTDSLEEEEDQVNEDLYHGDEQQDEAQDEEKRQAWQQPQQGVQPPNRDCCKRRVASKNDQVSMCHVDNLHDPENQGKTQGDGHIKSTHQYSNHNWRCQT